MIYFSNVRLKEADGITNKILLQVNALKKKFNNVHHVYINESGERTSSNFGTIDALSSNKYLFNLKLRTGFSKIIGLIKNDQDKIIYIRYTRFGSPSFVLFLKNLKKEGFKIVLEVPTFPYDFEHKSSLIKKIFNLIENTCRNHFKHYVDYVVTFSSDSEIFGIPCVNLSNCADPGLPVSLRNDLATKNRIDLVCVSSLVEWHGYDRLIRSLAEYNDKAALSSIDISVHIIGNGESLPNLQSMVKEYNLSDFVTFHGQLTGKELDRVMLHGDIGIDSLGRHRSGVFENNSLKSKEYLMRGLPIVKSHDDRTIDKLGYHFQVSCNDDSFDLNEVLNFVVELEQTPQSIRNVAESIFVWEEQFKLLYKKLSDLS
ncbi:glycosyltransferase [Vibrio breoganii]